MANNFVDRSQHQQLTLPRLPELDLNVPYSCTSSHGFPHGFPQSIGDSHAQHLQSLPNRYHIENFPPVFSAEHIGHAKHADLPAYLPGDNHLKQRAGSSEGLQFKSKEPPKPEILNDQAFSSNNHNTSIEFEDHSEFSEQHSVSTDSLPDHLDTSWYQPLETWYKPLTKWYHEPTKTVLTDDDNSGDEKYSEPEIVSIPAKRARGRPRKVPAKPSVTPAAQPHTDDAPKQPIISFELLLHLLLPDKIEKQEPEQRGPIFLQSDKSWDDFLDTISSLVPTPHTGLFLPTLAWRFLSPANSPWIPITTSEGYQSMLSQVKRKLAKGSGYIVVRMQKPIVAQNVHLPNSIRASFEEPESSDEDRPMSKMGKFDDRVETQAEKLLEHYGPGKCDIHPTLPCFFYRPTDLHFELTRPRRLVWAQAILNGTVDETQIPLSSKLFSKDQAIKVNRASIRISTARWRNDVSTILNVSACSIFFDLPLLWWDHDASQSLVTTHTWFFITSIAIFAIFTISSTVISSTSSRGIYIASVLCRLWLG
ncbi:hypothetical protein C8R42DRAFT_754357 [Lentinula raphanica]|nr:hypothetical protein C8R42DRAFT_754357 [Lentinula raphanica]